jgi:hypothetical protein
LEIKRKSNNDGCFITLDNQQDMRTLSLVNRYAFKWEQFLHFHKHQCISFALPLREKEERSTSIRVFSRPESDVKIVEKVVEDIEGEIKGTGDLLEELHLKVIKVD